MERDLRNGSVPTSEAVVVVCNSDVCQMGDPKLVLSWLNVDGCSGAARHPQLPLLVHGEVMDGVSGVSGLGFFSS